MSRLPDYEFKALNKRTDERNKVGAAWINDATGSIRIKLDAFIKLEASDDLVLTLFKIEPTRSQAKERSAESPYESPVISGERDDIPF